MKTQLKVAGSLCHCSCGRDQCSLCHCVNHCAFEHLKVGECWVMGGERQMTESASEVFVVITYVEFLTWVEFLTNAGCLTYME